MRLFVLCSPLILGLLLVPGGASADENECSATIDGTLMRKEESDSKKTYTSKVDVSAKELCAVVDFDLIVVEETSNGKQKEVRVPKQVKIRDATMTSLKLDYKLKRGRTIVDHRFEQTGCTICR